MKFESGTDVCSSLITIKLELNFKSNVIANIDHNLVLIPVNPEQQFHNGLRKLPSPSGILHSLKKFSVMWYLPHLLFGVSTGSHPSAVPFSIYTQGKHRVSKAYIQLGEHLGVASFHNMCRQHPDVENISQLVWRGREMTLIIGNELQNLY